MSSTDTFANSIKHTGSSLENRLKVGFNELNDKDRASVQIYIKQSFLSEEPKTPEELWSCIKALYGIELPITSTSEDCDAPFQWIWDFWKDKYPASFAIACRGGLKDLACDTPVLTYNRGWSTMGELEVGDYVFDANGNPTKVLQVSDIRYGKKCYRLKFNKADSIVASEDHIWKTLPKTNRRRKCVTPVLVETAAIKDTLKCGNETNHVIEVAKPLQYSEATNLPIDPYLFGLWLGDGSKHLSVFTTSDEELLNAFRQRYVVEHKDRYDYVVRGLCTDLRKLGFCKGSVKYVPDVYLSASVEQRMELIRGLMDSDGTAPPGKVMAYFSNTNKRIIDGLSLLLNSVAIPHTVSEVSIIVNEAPYSYWTISFSTTKPIFKLARKRNNQLEAIEKRTRLNSNENYHYIVDVEEVESVPTRCILVEHEDHMFLAGKSLVPTHNTFPASIITNLKCMYRPNYEAIIAAAIKKQSSVSQKYLQNFYKDDFLKGFFAKRPGQTAAEWNTGSTWQIVTGTTSGVCLSGWTSVVTDLGNIPIKDIVSKKLKCKVRSYDFSTGGVIWNDVVGWHDNGPETNYVKLVTKYKSVRALPSMTDNHIVFLADGSEKQAGRVQIGDRLAEYSYIPSEDEYQIILGGILGDATISKDGRFSFAHGSLQSEYSAWKAQHLSNFNISKCQHVSGYTGKDTIRYRTETSLVFKKLRDEWYATGNKQVTYDQLLQLNDLGVAVWFMDDGCYTGNSWTLWTCGFDHASQEAIHKFFMDRYGVLGGVKECEDGYYIRFCVGASEVLNDVLSKYIDVSVKQPKGWKRWIYDSDISTGSYGIIGNEVIEVRYVSLASGNRKYDLTVANNHNYFLASGLLVHNSGQHPNQFCLDEIEFWEVEALEQAFSVPKTKGGYPAQLQMFSTRQRSYGASNYLTNQIEQGKKDIKMYKWSIFEVLQKCNTCECIKGGKVVSNPHEKCILWEDCKGERARKATGIYTREEVCSLKQQVSASTWDTQYLCLKPSTHGLVLYNFEHAEMEIPSSINKGNYCNWTYTPDLPYYICHDPAQGQKSVVIFFQIYNGRMFIFDELIDSECFSGTKVKLDVINKIHQLGIECLPAAVIVDPHRTDIGKEWASESMGQRFNVEYPSMADGYDLIETGLELLRTFIVDGSGKRQVYVNKMACDGLCTAIHEHHYRIPKDNTLSDAAKPAEAFKDEIDTMRYAVIWATQRGLMRMRKELSAFLSF